MSRTSPGKKRQIGTSQFDTKRLQAELTQKSEGKSTDGAWIGEILQKDHDRQFGRDYGHAPSRYDDRPSDAEPRPAASITARGAPPHSPNTLSSRERKARRVAAEAKQKSGGKSKKPNRKGRDTIRATK